jgi:hypothetical protein
MNLVYSNIHHRLGKDGRDATQPFGDCVRKNLQVLKSRVSCEGLILHADMPVLAGWLVAVARRPGEAVEIALLGLPFAIKRGQGLLQASGAQPVRVSVKLRTSVPPCVIASYALIHHRPILVVSSLIEELMTNF